MFTTWKNQKLFSSKLIEKHFWSHRKILQISRKISSCYSMKNRFLLKIVSCLSFRELISSFHLHNSGRNTRITFSFFLSIISKEQKKENKTDEKASTVSMCTECFFSHFSNFSESEWESERNDKKENVVYTGDTTHSIRFSLQKTLNLNSRYRGGKSREKNKVRLI